MVSLIRKPPFCVRTRSGELQLMGRRDRKRESVGYTVWPTTRSEVML